MVLTAIFEKLDAQMTEVANTTERNYIAIILIGCGSSWARDKDPEKAIKRCARIIVEDWSSLFDLEGKTLPINLYDVTGHDEVSWSHHGIKGDGDGPITRIEVADVTLPKRRRR